MTLYPIDHTAEAERLIEIGQGYLDGAIGGIEQEVDLAGLHFDKAQVHATLAQVSHLASVAESLRAIVATDVAVEASNPDLLSNLRASLMDPTVARRQA